MERLTLSQFLKDNNTHAKFVFNALAYEGNLTFSWDSPIGRYFMWCDTKEGYQFWSTLDDNAPTNIIEDMTYLKDIQLTKRKKQ